MDDKEIRTTPPERVNELIDLMGEQHASIKAKLGLINENINELRNTTSEFFDEFGAMYCVGMDPAGWGAYPMVDGVIKAAFSKPYCELRIEYIYSDNPEEYVPTSKWTWEKEGSLEYARVTVTLACNRIWTDEQVQKAIDNADGYIPDYPRVLFKSNFGVLGVTRAGNFSMGYYVSIPSARQILAENNEDVSSMTITANTYGSYSSLLADHLYSLILIADCDDGEECITVENSSSDRYPKITATLHIAPNKKYRNYEIGSLLRGYGFDYSVNIEDGTGFSLDVSASRTLNDVYVGRNGYSYAEFMGIWFR